ncbi:hypothetical protein Y032_0479g2207 [Ancylostoma ceylanicum]|uniref:Uncharacterized protein n=1 Tax=Ancylostoma ceylanicum TaxID=53326 RepID=A0A016WVX8_9BILA|nr:hypothetical protein Y032_0479g2207 [Ancylostoma ceylanicum]
MGPSVIVEQVDKSSSRPSFSNSVRYKGDTSWSGGPIWLALAGLLFEEPYGMMRVGIEWTQPTLVSSNEVFQEHFPLRAKKERLTNRYPGELRVIDQDMRDPSSQHFSVAESLEATEDCWISTSESRRKTTDANLRVSFDGVENGGVFHRVVASRPRFVIEVHFCFLEARETALDSVDGNGVLSQCAVDVSNGFRGSCRDAIHRRLWLGGTPVELTSLLMVGEAARVHTEGH